MKKRLMTLAIPVLLLGCGAFVDENGETSIRQVAEGLQTLGDRVAEMGEAIERDADVEPVPHEQLSEAMPRRVRGASRLTLDGDRSTDRNGAGMSIAHGRFDIDGDSAFVGIADLGALQAGAGLVLEWAAPLFGRGDMDGELEEVLIEGYPGIRALGEDAEGVFVATLVEGRFVVIAGARDRRHEDFVWDALEQIDYRRLGDWTDYGR